MSSIEVATTRTTNHGEIVENVHRADAVDIDHRRGTIEGFGDTTTPRPVRSTVKPLQARALIDSGVANSFSIGTAELAVACGSHSGTPQHLAVIDNWLQRVGLRADSLRCPSALPMGDPTGPADTVRSPLHHECSGKHTGFMTLAVHIGADPSGYLDPDGPVQEIVLGSLADAFGTSRDGLIVGRDGCGAPVVCVSLSTLAHGLWTLAADSAGRAILDAAAGHPAMIAGPGHFDTLIGEADIGVLSKVGADGLHVAIVRDSGRSIAVKATDGSATAARHALVELLRRDGIIDEQLASTVAPRVVTDGKGDFVGHVRVSVR